MEIRVFGGIPGVIGKLVCYDYERILPFIVDNPSEPIAPEVFCFCSWDSLSFYFQISHSVSGLKLKLPDIRIN